MPDTRTTQTVGPALPRPIGGYQGSVAYWSKAPQRKLVLFVHGFTGSAIDSWLEFPRLLRLDPHFKGYDLVSFAYESNRQPATFSASAFYHFLSRIMDSPASTINAGLPTDLVRATTFGYDRVVIVAHSLGAVVARRALVNAHTQHAPWVGKIALLLFAPAHKGILATHLLGGWSAWLTAFVGILPISPKSWRNRNVVLGELAVGSAMLKALERDTRRALSGKNATYPIARRVVFGKLDNVVDTNPFADDPLPVVVPDKDHRTVCRPSDAYLEPVTLLLESTL